MCVNVCMCVCALRFVCFCFSLDIEGMFAICCQTPHSGDSDRAPLKEVQVTSQWPSWPFFGPCWGWQTAQWYREYNRRQCYKDPVTWANQDSMDHRMSGTVGVAVIYSGGFIMGFFGKILNQNNNHTSTKGISSWCWWCTEFTDLGFCAWKRLLRGGWPPTNSKPTNRYHQPTNASNKHAIWKTHVFSQYSMIHDSYLSPPPPKEQESKSSNHSMKHQIWSKKTYWGVQLAQLADL